jgi:hypothetical protein
MGKRVYTREAATVFLMACFRCDPEPIAGWDRRVKTLVPLRTNEQIAEYLSQFPKAERNLGRAH